VSMHENLLEKASDLGRMLGQTDEYRALGTARTRVSEDRRAVELLNKLAELEAEIGKALQSGEEPTEELQTEYEQAFSELQGSSVYQSLAAAQTNFDKILARVNEAMVKGMEAGAQSRIILPS
jgi:cell fate (sporulation/competence/biofilm development) regulator YlbF (YheA/YmcA/DUF963 family)